MLLHLIYKMRRFNSNILKKLLKQIAFTLFVYFVATLALPINATTHSQKKAVFEVPDNFSQNFKNKIIGLENTNILIEVINDISELEEANNHFCKKGLKFKISLKWFCTNKLYFTSPLFIIKSNKKLYLAYCCLRIHSS